MRDLWNRVENVAFVTVIAALVWLYAEGRSVAELRETLTIQLEPPPGQQLLIAEPGPDGTLTPLSELTVDVLLRGSRGALAQAEGFASEALVHPINPDEPEQTLELDTLLRELGLDELGVNLQEVTPRRQRVVVEPMVRVENIRVELRQADTGVTFAQPPRADPSTVTLLVPQSRAADARDAVVVARFDELDLAQFPEDLPQSRALVLDLPEGLDARFCRVEPAQTTVTFELSTAVAELELNAVPVWIAKPPSVDRDYAIDFADGMPRTVSLRVRGPAEAIDQLENGFRPAALIEITSDALAGRSGETSWPVERYLLPPGVTVVSRTPDTPWRLIVSEIERATETP